MEKSSPEASGQQVRRGLRAQEDLFHPVPLRYRLYRKKNPSKPITQVNELMAGGQFGFYFKGIRNMKRVIVQQSGMLLTATYEPSQKPAIPRKQQDETSVQDLRKMGLPRRSISELSTEVEIALLCSKHKNGLKLLDFFTRLDCIFLVYEHYICSLKELYFTEDEMMSRMEDHLLPYLMVPIFEAVNHLHTNNVVHTGVSLDTIFMTPDFVPKLGGLCSARSIGFEASSQISDGDRRGDPVFAAPEFMDPKRSYGRSVDTWSLGLCLLYLSIKMPVDEEHPMTTIFKDEELFKHWFYVYRRQANTAGKDLKALFETCICLDPEARPSVSEVMECEPYIYKSLYYLELEGLEDELDTYTDDINENIFEYIKKPFPGYASKELIPKHVAMMKSMRDFLRSKFSKPKAVQHNSEQSDMEDNL